MPIDTLILGEAVRTLDERYRLSLPANLAAPLLGPPPDCVLAKERPGCLSLWPADRWHACNHDRLELIQLKAASGRLDDRAEQLQHLGRLLSTRHTPIRIAGRGRLVIPEGFREFLAVNGGDPVIVVGAAVCVELWDPTAWREHVGEHMPTVGRLLEDLSR